MSTEFIGIAATAPHSETEIAPGQAGQAQARPARHRPTRCSPATWRN